MEEKRQSKPRQSAARRPDRVREIRNAAFAEKLAGFAAQLDSHEQGLLKEVLERGGLPEKDLAGARPGALGKTSIVALTPNLDASLFHRLLDW